MPSAWGHAESSIASSSVCKCACRPACQSRRAPRPRRQRGEISRMATSREEILEQVKGALSEKLGIDESEITEDASFEEDLGADSLDLVEVVMDLEDQFGLKIPDEDARELTTVGKAIDYVIAHQGGARTTRRAVRARSPDLAASCCQVRAGVHARLVGRRPRGLVRAPRVPRRQRPRAGDRAGGLRPLREGVRRTSRQASRACGVAPELRRGREGARPW